MEVEVCADCKKEFAEDQEKVYAAASAKYGDYYPISEHPICEDCSDKRYKEHVLKFER